MRRLGSRVQGRERRRRRKSHLEVAALADNTLVMSLLTSVRDQILIATRAGLDTPRVNNAGHEHAAILQAITDGHPNQARCAVAPHVDHTRNVAVHHNYEAESRL
ncbi:FCD domain-containing protein [Rhodococcus sp. H29-C3]|uniref:FCD domain-containing protein n=1 Tax=Rhodococcus sp. H29-C3 TaxID=3046307 RepID=UPI0024B935EA|nr:FCD domain-containing protein [Rhodococcus sp. H29-C3]MDJ0363205.1 FCD domain-containing protein [Rhodococcus sp. H29-C3]